MRIALCSVCTVVALSFGCIGDNGLYLPGELPGFWESGATDRECQLDVDGESPAGDRDARPAIPAFTGMRGRVLVGVGASAHSVGFNTSSCEVRATE